MILLTQSLEHWLFKFHPEKMLIMFGKVELFTWELAKEYLEWCQTEEGLQYLAGGSKYDAEHPGNMASANLAGRKEECK